MSLGEGSGVRARRSRPPERFSPERAVGGRLRRSGEEEQGCPTAKKKQGGRSGGAVTSPASHGGERQRSGTDRRRRAVSASPAPRITAEGADAVERDAAVPGLSNPAGDSRKDAKKSQR